jgi:hypothetical protein
MPWERPPKRTATEISEWVIKCIKVRWSAYKTIQGGGTAYCGDKEMYKTVRQRLKRMFQGNEEKLSRFKLLEDERKD